MAACFVASSLVVGACDGGGSASHADLVEAERLRRVGNFEAARQKVEQLRAWATDEAKRVRLQSESQRIDELELRVQQRKDAILAQSGQRNYAQFSDDLKRDERSAKDEESRAVARIVRSGLTELLRGAAGVTPPPERPKAQPQQVPSVAQQAVPAPLPAVTKQPEPRAPSAQDSAIPKPIKPIATPAPAAPVASDAGSAVGSVNADDVSAAIASAIDFVARSEFSKAIAQLDLALGGAVASDRDRLARELESVQRAAKAQLDQIVARVRNEADNGRLRSAIDALVEAEPRFPKSGPFAALTVLYDELRRREAGGPAAASGVGEAVPEIEALRRRTLEQLAPDLVRIRALESDGDFAAARADVLKAAASIRASDSDYASRLDLRAADLERVIAWHAEVAAVVAASPTDVLIKDRGPARIVGVDGPLLRVAVAGGEEKVSWLVIEPDSIAQIAAAGKFTSAASLGAASLLYRADSKRLAERALAKALQADASLQQEVWRTVAHGRGEPIDPRGYELRADGFVSAANVEAEKQAQKVLSRIDSALRSKDKKVRESIITDALALGPAAVGAVAARFQRMLDKEIEALDASPLRKQVDKLRAQRAHLDEARAFAKELIYDEVKYFYPYKPPQVDSDRYAEYVRVQAEVNRRVDVVRADWSDERIKVKVPSNVADSIDRLDWIATVLRDLAELDPLALVGVEWARALIPGETLGIRTFCKSFEEREQRQRWRKIEAYNETLCAQIDRGEAEQLRITNAYRAMFGHRPLALDLRIRAAARGHAQEMSKLGYFSHFSPTPGRKSPTDRMLIAGYARGVGENIALNDGAEPAHNAWCNSSGHHRNLLNPNHTEAGMGNDGRYWVQNFGNGVEHEQKIEAESKAR